jgi:glucose-6-phosphate 1-epimerase
MLDIRRRVAIAVSIIHRSLYGLIYAFESIVFLWRRVNASVHCNPEDSPHFGIHHHEVSTALDPFRDVPTKKSATTTTTTTATTTTVTTALFGSRQRQKQASRKAWLSQRGLDATTTAESSSVVSLSKNADGLEYVTLRNSNGHSATIYLYGGVVTSYIVDSIEYIAVRPDAKMDGSKPISGGLSHCWPQFGPGAIQQHGFARNVHWTVDSGSDTQVVLSLVPSDYTKAIWDKPFACQFTVRLDDDQLVTKMEVKNTGTDAPWDFSAALHSYFTTSALSNLEITGSFAGKEFLNKLAGSGGEMQTETRSAITIGEEYDRVYKGVNDPVLKDSGRGKALAVLNTAGWEDTVLWNPYGNEGMGYNNFVCVESVKFDPVTLNGGSSWVGDMTLKVSDL